MLKVPPKCLLLILCISFKMYILKGKLLSSTLSIKNKNQEEKKEGYYLHIRKSPKWENIIKRISGTYYPESRWNKNVPRKKPEQTCDTGATQQTPSPSPTAHHCEEDSSRRSTLHRQRWESSLKIKKWPWIKAAKLKHIWTNKST